MAIYSNSNGNVYRRKTDVVIANGGTTSTSIHIPDEGLIGIHIPASTTNVLLAFQASLDDVTFVDMYNASDDKLEATIGTTARFVAFSWDDFLSAQYLRLMVSTAEAAERTYTLITRTFL